MNINTDSTHNSAEIVDIVDKDDNIIGEMLKTEANKNPNVIHREIAIVLFDENNKLLWQQRSFDKVVAPGFWTLSAAGHVTKGFSIDEIAHMELTEELGFDTQLVFIEKEFRQRDNEANFFYWYIGKYSGEEIIIQKEEVETVKFLDRIEMEEMIRKGYKMGDRSIDMSNRLWNGEFDKFKEQLN